MTKFTASDICIIIHDFGAGGTERIAIRLANAWIENGRSVSILCGNTVGPLLGLVDPHVSVIEASPRVVRGPASRRRLGEALAPLIDEIRPSLLFVPGNFHVPVVIPLLSKLRQPRPRLVVKLSNPIHRATRSSLGQWIFESRLRHSLGHADAIITMASILCTEARIATRHPNVTTISEPILSGQILLPRSPGDTFIELIAAGRFVPQKNFQLAIKALALIPDRRFRLTILGDGPERTALQATVKRLGLGERVSMPGYVADIRANLSGASLFLLPSLYEGYPAVAVEALAAGVPVVATDCSPAIRDIIGGPELGIVIEGREPRVMAAAILEQTRRTGSIALPASDVLKRHHIGAVSNQYLNVFDAVMNAPATTILEDKTMRAKFPAQGTC